MDNIKNFVNHLLILLTSLVLMFFPSFYKLGGGFEPIFIFFSPIPRWLDRIFYFITNILSFLGLILFFIFLFKSLKEIIRAIKKTT